ncbi:hypothetical protein VTI28DRAFT_9182 [Corynascus sepedonium]
MGISGLFPCLRSGTFCDQTTNKVLRVERTRVKTEVALGGQGVKVQASKSSRLKVVGRGYRKTESLVDLFRQSEWCTRRPHNEFCFYYDVHLSYLAVIQSAKSPSQNRVSECQRVPCRFLIPLRSVWGLPICLHIIVATPVSIQGISTAADSNLASFSPVKAECMWGDSRVGGGSVCSRESNLLQVSQDAW